MLAISINCRTILLLMAEGYFLRKANEVGARSKGYIYGFFMESKGYPELSSSEIEIAVMELPEIDSSNPHYHLEATEITYIISGSLTLNLGHVETPGVYEQVIANQGDFFVVRPGTVLQNPENEPGTIVYVVKFPSVPNDKFYIND